MNGGKSREICPQRENSLGTGRGRPRHFGFPPKPALRGRGGANTEQAEPNRRGRGKPGPVLPGAGRTRERRLAGNEGDPPEVTRRRGRVEQGRKAAKSEGKRLKVTRTAAESAGKRRTVTGRSEGARNAPNSGGKRRTATERSERGRRAPNGGGKQRTVAERHEGRRNNPNKVGKRRTVTEKHER